jgi:hypothetical protein
MPDANANRTSVHTIVNAISELILGPGGVRLPSPDGLLSSPDGLLSSPDGLLSSPDGLSSGAPAFARTLNEATSGLRAGGAPEPPQSHGVGAHRPPQDQALEAEAPWTGLAGDPPAPLLPPAFITNPTGQPEAMATVVTGHLIRTMDGTGTAVPGGNGLPLSGLFTGKTLPLPAGEDAPAGMPTGTAVTEDRPNDAGVAPPVPARADTRSTLPGVAASPVTPSMHTEFGALQFTTAAGSADAHVTRLAALDAVGRLAVAPDQASNELSAARTPMAVGASVTASTLLTWSTSLTASALTEANQFQKRSHCFWHRP